MPPNPLVQAPPAAALARRPAAIAPAAAIRTVVQAKPASTTPVRGSANGAAIQARTLGKRPVPPTARQALVPPTRVLQRASTHVDGHGDFISSRGAELGDYGYRQLRMRTVSTALRNGMHYAGGGTRRAVNIFNITLLHGWNTSNTKTAQRIKSLTESGIAAVQNTAVAPLTAHQIDTIMPSTEEIQIVERANAPGTFVTLQGVGRLVAIRKWLQDNGVFANFYVEVMCYPASGMGANQLVDISNTYDAQESFLSRNIIGPAIYATGTIAAMGLAALGAWAAYRRWR